VTNKLNGSVFIANDVLADIAGYAALESYGVVGMANASFLEGASALLPGQRLRRGVRITDATDAESPNGAVEIDLFVVIEYGTNLAEVSHNLADLVAYTIEHLTEIKVLRCDVHVVDVKVR
jgi:uncharacterized alkaline shock family protein YloU